MARGNRSRSRKDTADTATTQVDDRGSAVEQAVAASVAEDAPEAVSSATDAVSDTSATEISTAREVGARLEGQDLALSEEQLAETITEPDDDADGLLRVPGLDDLKDRKPGEDLAGAEGDPDAPSDDPRERAEASKDFNPFGTRTDGAGGAQDFGSAGGESSADVFGDGGPAAQAIKDAGIFDLIDQPGQTDGDPLSSFLDAAEAKLGHDTGLTTPSDETNDAVAPFGKEAVSKPIFSMVQKGEGDDQFFSLLDQVSNVDAGIFDSILTVTNADTGEVQEFHTVVDDNNDTITTLSPNGATKTVRKSTGEVIDETPPLVDPGPDGEVAPLPEEFQKQLDAEVARLRAARPDTGDGVTDPVESDVEVIDPSATLPTHAEQGQELFGQPDTEAPSGSDANFNPGADSTGAGVITPGDDQTVATGSTRNDDPFADAGTPPEPVTSSNDATPDSPSFLPSETTGTAIDDRGDVPDPSAATLPDGAG